MKYKLFETFGENVLPMLILYKIAADDKPFF